MSGYAETQDCPKCGKNSLEISIDSTDPMCNSGTCWNCGYYHRTIEGQVSLEELNKMRVEISGDIMHSTLKPKKTLPKIKIEEDSSLKPIIIDYRDCLPDVWEKLLFIWDLPEETCMIRFRGEILSYD